MSVNTAWMDRALCVGADPETWFEGSQRDEAKRICVMCPVVESCQAAGADEYRGIWGGEENRRKNVGPSPSAEYVGYRHGTDAGYSQHLRDNTPPCGSCLTAHMYAGRAKDQKRVRTPDQIAAQRERRRAKAAPIRQQRARIGLVGDLPRGFGFVASDDLGAIR